MKKILAMAAVAALAAGASAYAANPFSDVSTSDWAYQAVADLSDQGIVEGYPDGTFQGQTNITRYEMAQIIARLMAREDQYNAEQRATIDKLAGEYADELDSLGVRVSNLEKKVGNISWAGDARMRWQQGYEGTDAKDDYNGRLRLKIKGQVNENTYVAGRFLTKMNFKDGEDADTTMDELYVHHQFGEELAVKLGRFDYVAGQTGLFYADELDGVMATIGGDKLALELGYGRMKAWKGNIVGADESNPEIFLARLTGTANRLAYDVEYFQAAGDEAAEGQGATLWGAGLTYGITNSIDVFGDYYQNTDYKGDPQLWTAGLAYGHYDLKKPGTFRIGAQYVKAEAGAYFGATNYTVTALDQLKFGGEGKLGEEAKYWMATADVVLAENVRLHGEYAFDVEVDNNSDYDDLATVSLNYVF